MVKDTEVVGTATAATIRSKSGVVVCIMWCDANDTHEMLDSWPMLHWETRVSQALARSGFEKSRSKFFRAQLAEKIPLRVSI